MTLWLTVVSAGPVHAIDISWDNELGNDQAAFASNWDPNQIPTSVDNVILTNSFAGPQIVDFGGLTGQVNRVESSTTNVPHTASNGTVEIFLTSGDAITTRDAGDALTFDTDLLLVRPNANVRFLVEANAQPIVVNGNLASSAGSGTTTLQLASQRDLALQPFITINGVISDGLGGAVLELAVGSDVDAGDHRGVVRVTGLNTYTGQTVVHAAKLQFNSIADLGAASALGAPATVPSGTIRLGRAPGHSGTLRYTGSGHSSNRSFALEGSGGVLEADATATGGLTLSGGFTAPTSGTKTLELGGDGAFEHENTLTGVVEDGVGTVALLKTGSSIWALGAANTYTGGTTIEQGTLKTLGDHVIPAAQFLFRDGTLDMSDHAETIGPGAVGQTGLILGGVTGATPEILLGNSGSMSVSTLGTFIEYDATDNPGTARIMGAGTSQVTLATNSVTRTFDIGDSTATEEELIIGVPLFNGGAATTNDIGKLGAGRLILSADNDYSKGTAVDAGALQIRHGGGLGQGGSSSAGTTVADGASLELSNGITVADEHLTLTGNGPGNDGALRSRSGNNSWGGPISLAADSTIGVDANTLEVSDGIGGSGHLTKTGAGILSFGDANSYSGGTTIEEGTLRTLADQVIPTGQFLLRDGTLDVSDRLERVGPGAVSQTGMILGGVAGATPEIQLGTSGDFSVSTQATFIQYDATNDPGTARVSGTGMSVLNLATSSISRNFDIGDSMATDEELIIDARIFNAGAATTNDIVKLGDGRLVVTADNDYSKVTQVNAGAWQIRHAGALGLGDSTSTAGTAIAAGAALELSGNIGVVNEHLRINGSGIDGTGALRSLSGTNSWSGPILLDGNSTIGVDNASSLTISGVVSDSNGSGGLTKTGTGDLTLSGMNTFSGVTNINEGTLVVGAAGALPSPADADVHDGVLDLGAFTLEFNELDVFGGEATANAGLEITAGTGTLTIQTGGRVLVGGELTVSSTAAVNMTGGTLDVTTLDLTAAGSTFNMSGGVLHADTVEGNLSLSGGKLAPGNSAGTTTVTDDYLPGSGASLEIEIGGNQQGEYDRVDVQETAMLDGMLDVVLIDPGSGLFVPSPADSFTIITSASLSGEFNNAANGARLFSLGGEGSFLVNYDGVLDTVRLSDFALLADMDCDADVDLDDVDDFVLGLTDAEAYENQYGVSPALKGDTDRDGDQDLDDVNGFVAILTGNGSGASAGQSVPEPGSGLLLGLGAGIWVCLRRHRLQDHDFLPDLT